MYVCMYACVCTACFPKRIPNARSAFSAFFEQLRPKNAFPALILVQTPAKYTKQKAFYNICTLVRKLMFHEQASH